MKLGALLGGCAVVATCVTMLAQGRQAAAPGQVPAPAPAGLTQKGTGYILGQVVDASTGKPIPDAVVTLVNRAGAAAAAAAGGRGAAPPAPPRLLTDSDGHFVFHDLAKGNYPISATATGYVNANSGQQRPNGPARPIELGDGERLTGVKVRMWKYAVVSGTVLDEGGEPAVGIAVRVLRRTVTRGHAHYQPGAGGKTDDRGIYRISTIVPGEFLIAIPQTLVTMPVATMDQVIKSVTSGMPGGSPIGDLIQSGGTVSAGGIRVGEFTLSASSSALPSVRADGRVMAFQTLFYPSATSSAAATMISLASGEEHGGVDFQLRLVPTLRVSGTLNGPTGPLPSTAIKLAPVGSDDVTGNGLDAASTSTGPDGSFTFLGVPPGQYVAQVFKSPRPPIPPELAGSPLMQMAFGSGGAPGATQGLFAQASVSVGSNDVTGMNLTMTEGASVSGRFEFDDGVTRLSPQELQRAVVAASVADNHVAPTIGGGKVDAEGRFKITGLTPGAYTITTQGGLPATMVMKSITAGGHDVTFGAFDVTDADVNDVVVTLTDKRAQLTGAVRGMESAPDAFVSVLLFPADFHSWVALGMNVNGTRTAVASKTGAFTMGSVLAGDYFVAAIADADLAGNDQDLGFFEALARVASRVTIAPGDKKTQDLSIVKVVR